MSIEQPAEGPREEEAEQDTERQVEKRENLGEKFFDHLSEYKDWVEKYKADSMERLEVAKNIPEGVSHDGNLMLGDDGKVYAILGGDSVYEMVRESDEPFAPYKHTLEFKFERGDKEIEDGSVQSVKKPDGTKLTFVKRSWNENYGDEFGWRRDDNTREDYSAAKEQEGNIETIDNGLALVEALTEKKEEIEAWMKAYAQSQGNLREGRDAIAQDWPALLANFAPELKGKSMPDNSGLVVTLHAILDEIALGKKVREYYI